MFPLLLNKAVSTLWPDWGGHLGWPGGRRSSPRRKHINLALQGGGSHGAFTWGVLDRLLEDPRIALEGVSATSSGAMNAAVLADGLTLGGPDGAREALDRFWRHLAQPTTLWAPLQA